VTSERAQAYGRVVRTLEEMGPAKLVEREQDVIREAADTLFFCERVDDSGVRDALHAIQVLAERLVESERWTRERADRLVNDVSACGPAQLVTL
jgi:limonene-1,2-epoxide hydrolase